MLSDKILRLRPRQEAASAEFLNALLGFAPVRESLTTVTGGSHMRNISQSALRAVQVRVPPITAQRRIAAILSSVDDAIETAQAVIDQLQVVKKAMIAELLTRGLPRRHTRFKQTEIGDVPAEWDVTTLGALTADSAFGPRFPATQYDDSGNFGTLRTTDITEDWEINYSTMPRASLDERLFAAHVLQDGDVLVTRSGTCGVVTVFRTQSINVVPGAFLIRFRLRQPDDAEFVRLAMMTPTSQSRLQSMAAGGVQKNLSGTNLATLSLPMPQEEERKEIVRICATNDGRLNKERAYFIQLQTLKTSLMSALLTGEIRVPADEGAA
jgi:type I restriction enzyme S subunit